ncbi:SNF2 family N-terminal domain-containing protein [Boletus edulis BED1]|uniref:SNF2 family N-terminal domain-containing protein n=1 Tax=Boletus edulis BED1 TaxID=1328754 RepID=A0AAD4C8S9_BOLED|nr:SNF2 family N-terminal domain-containing protein [Boletus edulis BED1]
MEARRKQLLQDPSVYPEFYKPGQKPSQLTSSSVSIPSSSGSSEPQSLPSVVKKNNKTRAIIISSDEEDDTPTHELPELTKDAGAAAKSHILTTLDRATLVAPPRRTAVPAPIELPTKTRVPSNADIPTWETFDAPDEHGLYDPRMSAVEAEKTLRALVEDTVNDTEDAEIDMTEAIVPGFVDGIVLLPHQVIGRNWMRERETGKKTGGILADDMGLGKTIQTLARIVDGRAKKSDKLDGLAASTLVVCPVSLVSQWASEISRMAVGLRVIEHHGQSRTTDPLKLQQAHVVVTSYSIVASEYATFAPETKDESKSKKSKSKAMAAASDSDSDSSEGFSKKLASKKRSGKSKDALFRVTWFRIVLDEAHNIKNRNTKSAIACCALEGKFRWCLTGTPLQNTVEELYSLIKFLRIRPLNDWHTFNEQIAKPVKAGRSVRALKRLQVVLKAIMLRRTKNQILNGKPLLQLPERVLELVECSFSASEKEFYRLLESRMSSEVNKLVQSDKVNYTHVLVLLLRLRQACNHPSLVSKDFHVDRDATEPKATNDDEDDAEDLAAMFGQLGMSGAKKCQLCQTTLATGDDVTHCRECQPLAKSTEPTSKSKLPPDSAKIRKILEILKKIGERSEGVEKTIIFSQFTTMLDLIEPFLDAHGVKHVRYDGSMPKDKREASLEKIRNSKTVHCILISFKAGSTGLNLTACNNVILADMWWNPALEDQAYDRAHRFGQTRDVNIYKLMIPDTVETRILQLQDTKRELAKAALSGDKIKNMKLGMDDLLALFRGGGRDDDDDDE